MAERAVVKDNVQERQEAISSTLRSLQMGVCRKLVSPIPGFSPSLQSEASRNGQLMRRSSRSLRCEAETERYERNLRLTTVLQVNLTSRSLGREDASLAMSLSKSSLWGTPASTFM